MEPSDIWAEFGDIDRTITVKATIGYRLTIVVKLKPSEEAEPPEEIEGEAVEKKVMVEILSTPTGFLRVREAASTAAKELTQVKPGQRFPFVEEDTENNWFKIEYLPAQAGEEGKEGWVTGQYAKKVEVEPTKAASPSATLTPTKKPTPTPTLVPSVTP